MNDVVYVEEGWWHPSVNKGKVHDHNSRQPPTMHRLCERVYTRRDAATGHAVVLPEAAGERTCEPPWVPDEVANKMKEEGTWPE